MAEIKFQIIKNLKVLSKNEKNGWTKEINLISWNDAEPKFDIRSWDPEHHKMGRGVTLSKEELQELLSIDPMEFEE
ncbi:YdbC family protein [Xylocopilactobacillus apis]|uniref:Transcriptional coactivator p15 (PC4) C-terminal domain-containing protein n=1 Tax=Xylocopilactobacillus apis TaxID=2932183 RepID=A0AAU9D0Q8_9LACO|nr:PC4/YdbC family ssDNA-binding protein [Xylocopilactobacillus apis]BDR56081.1 hypothetical protein KIMC2_06430 [Xylocopilactobacillus apis]